MNDSLETSHHANIGNAAMTARVLMQQAAQALQLVGVDSARKDVELLLLAAWEISATGLIIKMLDVVPEAVLVRFDGMLQRRIKREPVAYILGYKEFWSRDFLVTTDVLVPRPETEHLIEQVLQYYPNQDESYTFADIGAGSGCIGVTLAKEYPNARVVACDISPQALLMTRKNAEKHDVASRMTFYQGDLYQALPAAMACDAIVSNPPYVSKEEMLALEAELSFEPRFALTDEDTGLTLLQKLLHGAPQYLKDDGLLMLESGLCGMPSAEPPMIKLADYHDLAANFRGSVFQFKPA